MSTVAEGLNTNICYTSGRFMCSENAVPLLYIYMHGKSSLELCQIFRNPSVTQNATVL